MRFIGIDPGIAKTGIAIFDTEKQEIGTRSLVSSKEDSSFHRQLFFLREIFSLLSYLDIVIMEDFAISGLFSKFSAKLVERIELSGMLKVSIPRHTKLPVLLGKPSFAKMFITGNGNATKSDVFLTCKRELGIKVRNDDEADALSLCLLGYTSWRLADGASSFSLKINGIEREIKDKKLEACFKFKEDNRYFIQKAKQIIFARECNPSLFS